MRWTDAETGYSLWLLERPPFAFPRLVPNALSSSSFGVPSLQHFQEMWAAWDFVTRKMIPDSMLLEKPIDLRHICLFYTGHIPTFLDIHLSRLLKEPHTEPDGYKVRRLVDSCASSLTCGLEQYIFEVNPLTRCWEDR